MTQDKQIAKLEKKITDLKVMKKSARSLQKKRIKLKIKLSDILEIINLVPNAKSVFKDVNKINEKSKIKNNTEIQTRQRTISIGKEVKEEPLENYEESEYTETEIGEISNMELEVHYKMRMLGLKSSQSKGIEVSRKEIFSESQFKSFKFCIASCPFLVKFSVERLATKLAITWGTTGEVTSKIIC